MRAFWASLVLLLAMLPATVAQAAEITTAQLVSVSPSGAGLWTFSVGGWQGGGLMTGSFAGTDTNTNGQLSYFNGEVTAFSASYSGGTIVGPVSFTFANLFGLVYDLNGGPLGDGTTLDVEGIGASAGANEFVIGPGPFNICGTGAPCGLIAGPASTVPEPSTLTLVISGVALAIAAGRRRLLCSPRV